MNDLESLWSRLDGAAAMTAWRISQSQSRRRYLEMFDADEVAAYDAQVGKLFAEDITAYRDDLADVYAFESGQSVLDAGAGTGALCEVLATFPGIAVTALEPAPAMLARLRSKPSAGSVVAVPGFCDSPDDRGLFAPGTFDAVFSRQLANGLYDPVAAFRNWRHWLKPHGSVVLIDGLYGRDAWTGAWANEVDVLPLSATQTPATVAYLLELAGFRVDAVRAMERVNARPTTRTQRYVVVARVAG